VNLDNRLIHFCFVSASSQFGSKILPIKPVIKFVPKLLADRDKTVRDEAKLLAVEMYRWAGNAIMPQLQSVTPLIMTELEEAFKDIKEGNAEKARQTHFLRSQEDLKEKMEAGGGEAGENGGGQEEEALDPYDLLEPFDVLSKLPTDFKHKLVSGL
jgi:cytoskeleton-associated protein 5